MSDPRLLVSSSDLEVDDEVVLILCSLLGWFLFARLGFFAESKASQRRGSCVEAKLQAASLSDVSCKDWKIHGGGLLVRLRRSILRTVIRRCSASHSRRRSLKSLRRVSFCEEVNYRALEPRQLSLRQELEQRARVQEEEEQLQELEEASSSNTDSASGKREVTEKEYAAMMVRTTIPLSL